MERKKRTIEELTEEARKIDAKKKKKTVKVEKEEQLLQHILNKKEETPKVEKIIKKQTSDWDVKIGDPIEFFDPTLSYELTGYRPITQDQGLDFDPKVFTKAADAYRKNGKYTNLIPGTFAHRQYWEEEFRRCRDGYTVGKYTLTGENYFWLNYYRLPSVLDKSGAELQEENFPSFLAKQYEYFHYLALCRKLGVDGVAFKARGVNKHALL